MNNQQRVLFLCTGNSARSQMAEALLRHYAGDRFEVHSAGLEPKGIHPFTMMVIEEIGPPLTGHTSKGVNVYLGKVLSQYLITVCDKAEQNCLTNWSGVNLRLHRTFEDPAAYESSGEEILAKFREVRNQIEQKVRLWASLQMSANSLSQTKQSG